MLPAAHRLSDAHSFRQVTRQGRRARSHTLVLHLLRADARRHEDASSAVRVGLIVSKAVGNAVTRNRVKRRLRHLVRERLDLVPAGDLVVRALPGAGTASGASLRADLDACLAGVRR